MPTTTEGPTPEKKIRMEPSEGTTSDYFTSYEDLEVHKLMLEDCPRTFAYRRALEASAPYLKDKVVMDVGCGTGVLAVLCARAGARRVYAVEASRLARLARDIVKENGYEQVIEVIESRVEDVSLPGGERVDAIVSEWMGFYLLHEGMLDSVLVARDKFLKPGGHMFPESATIYAAPCSVPSMYANWESVQGVSMKAFGAELRRSGGGRPAVLRVQPEELLAREEALCWINLREDTPEDLDHYTLRHVVGASKAGQYQGICVWFDCSFPELSSGGAAPEQLSTSPFSPPTHWRQSVIVLPQERAVEPGEPIAFELDIRRAEESRRRYNLQVTLLDPQETEHPTPCSCHMTKCIVISQFMQEHPERRDRQGEGEGVVLRDPAEYDSGSDSDD